MAADAKPAPKFKELGVRLVTALAFFALCILPFYFGGWIWTLLVGLLSARMMYEWVRMSDTEGGWLPLVIALGGLAVALIYAGQGLEIYAVAAVIVATLIAVAERYRRGDAEWTAIGLPYIIIPTVLIVLLRGPEVGFATRGFSQLVFIILVVIAADVGAYFGGSQFGGPKLAPKLSPNKTWSGAISGAVFAVVIAALVGLVIGLPVWVAALLALPIVAASVLGDLLESTFKRRLDVKDTGTLLPGHGGLLDRLDSLMAAVVVAAFLFMAIGHHWPVH